MYFILWHTVFYRKDGLLLIQWCWIFSKTETNQSSKTFKCFNRNGTAVDLLKNQNLMFYVCSVLASHTVLCQTSFFATLISQLRHILKVSLLFFRLPIESIVKPKDHNCSCYIICMADKFLYGVFPWKAWPQERFLSPSS